MGKMFSIPLAFDSSQEVDCSWSRTTTGSSKIHVRFEYRHSYYVEYQSFRGQSQFVKTLFMIHVR